MDKPRVLFLCTGNSARSQMAEGILREYARDHFDIYSAGLEPNVINPYTVQVLDEIGVDTTPLYAKPLTLYLGKMHFSYLITVCANAEEKCPIFPGMGIRLHWAFEDPAAFRGSEEEILQKFRQIRNQIDQKIQVWLAEQKIHLTV